MERSTFTKEVNTQNFFTFELGAQEGVNVTIWIIIGFQQGKRQDSENLNNDTFYRPSVPSAQCILGTEKYPDSAFFWNFDDDDDFSQGCGQIKQAFKALTKDDILNCYRSDHDFRPCNEGNNIGYKLYVFDIRYQKHLESAQPNNVEFLPSENIPTGKYGYALVLTNKLVSISSDVQRQFDLIEMIFDFFKTLSFFSSITLSFSTRFRYNALVNYQFYNLVLYHW